MLMLIQQSKRDQ